MYGDPQAIRALARRIEEQATTAHADAVAVGRATREVVGSGLAVTALCTVSAERALALHEAARRLEAAAAALRAHARAMEELLALIAEIERRVSVAVDEALHRVRRFLDEVVDVLDPRDERLAGFVAPPSGSVAWLSVQLPGVALPPVPAR